MKDELSLLQTQLTYKKRLEAMLLELKAQRDPLQKKVAQLEAALASEQEDVTRLEGKSLAAFVYSALGRREEKLDKERRGFYAARAKYEAAARELSAIEEDIAATEEDLADLSDCEDRYRRKLEEKQSAIASAGTADAQAVLEKQQTLNYLIGQDQELEEAIEAGTTALRTLHQVAKHLQAAENWGSFDLLGGGILADMAKHESLDDAQQSIEQLQIDLQRFNKELADVTIRPEIQARVSDMLKFADFFFDNIFTDAAVLDKIQQAQAQVDHTRDEILGVLRQLQTKLEQIHSQQARAHQELEELILKTEL